MYRVNNSVSGGIAKTRSVSIMSNFNDGRGSLPDIEFYEIEPAEVISIKYGDDIKNEEEIGKITFRFLYSDKDKDVNHSEIAFPMKRRIKDYPLVGEIVYIIQMPNAMGSDSMSYYYIEEIPIFNDIRSNAFKGFSTEFNKSEESNLSKKKSPKPVKKKGVFSYKDVAETLPYEGDTIIESRFGASLRFSSTQKEGAESESFPIGKKKGSPILILSVGSRSEYKNKPYKEDFRKDDNFMAVTTDQTIGISIGSSNKSAWKSDYPKYFSGNQFIFNSDRIVLNAVKNEIILSAKKSVGLSSDMSFYLDVGDKTVINSPKIYLGIDSTEPLLLGKKWVSLMKEMISAIKQLKYYNTIIPGSDAQLMQVQNKLETILSKQNFTL